MALDDLTDISNPEDITHDIGVDLVRAVVSRGFNCPDDPKHTGLGVLRDLVSAHEE